MKLNEIQLVDPAVSTYYPIRKPLQGALLGERIVEQGPRRGFGRGAQNPTFVVDAWVMQSTQVKAQVVLQQLNELAHNPQYGPVYVTWIDTSTTDQDGWYDFEGHRPDYSLVFGGKAKTQLSLRRHAETTRQRLIGWRDATQTTTLTGVGATAIGLPQSSVATGINSFNRVAAEGSNATVIPSLAANGWLPVLNSPPVYTYRVRVYDRNGSNAVPTGGTFTNANWVEVYGPDHDFVGDVILTNGLVLLHFQVGTAIQAYFWNQYAGGPGWTLFAQVAFQGDSSISNRNLLIQQAHLQRLVSEEGRVVATLTDSTAGWSGTMDIRLQRNMRYADVQATLLQGSGNAGIALVGLPNALKLVATDNGAADPTLSPAESSITNALKYGMSLGISSVAANLWLPVIFTANGTGLTAPGTTSMSAPQSAQNVLQRAGIGAIPWSVSPVALQREAESNRVGTTTLATDAAASPNAGANDTVLTFTAASGAQCVPGADATGVPAGISYLGGVRARMSSSNAAGRLQIVTPGGNQNFVVNSTTFAWFLNQTPSVAANSQLVKALLFETIYKTTILNEPNLNHYYRLGEPSGTVANDAATVPSNGTYAGTPTLGVTGALINDPDTAATFNGTTGKVTVAGTTGWPSANGAWTIEAWINYAAAGDISSAYVAAFGDANVTRGAGYLYLTNSAGSIFPGVGNGTDSVTSAVSLSAGAWHHLVAEYDGAALRIFSDGVNRASTAVTSESVTLGFGRIACRNNNAVDQGFLKASVDEVAFYGIALSQAQVTNHNAVGTVAQNLILDEFVLLPILNANDGPAENWQQWLADRLARYPAFR